jgi:hypothetical protein
MSKQEINLIYGGDFALMLDVKTGVMCFETLDKYYQWDKTIPN